MTNTTISHLSRHTVHSDPIDAALALLADSSLVGHLVCDGSCHGVASCTVAPVDTLVAAA